MQITGVSLLPRWRDEHLALYTIHDVEDDAVGDVETYPKYWGSAHNSGAWVIMKQIDADTYRYFAGRTAYIAAWAARAGHDYDYLFNITLDA